MTKIMRLSTIGMVLLTGVCTLVIGQNTNTDREMSVEESYRQESVELMIIREQSRAESREMKLIALEYIKEAIEKGNTGEEIQGALEYLIMEGILNKTLENGRVTNNFPEVRLKAATYLGDLGTPEAKSTLIKLIRTDKEPMVLQEAVKSLGRIGTNEDNDAIYAISGIVGRKNNLGQPDNLLAFSALDAYDKIAKANNGIQDPMAIQTIIGIVDGNYSPTVRNRARQVLAGLRDYFSGNSERKE